MHWLKEAVNTGQFDILLIQTMENLHIEDTTESKALDVKLESNALVAAARF